MLVCLYLGSEPSVNDKVNGNQERLSGKVTVVGSDNKPASEHILIDLIYVYTRVATDCRFSLRICKLSRFLLDGGSTGNTIRRSIISKMNCGTVPQGNMVMDVADGSTDMMNNCVCITVVIADTTRVVAAAVDGPTPPTYSLLLGSIE
ncbi:hypothetical protein N7491_007935 [Penicillium cf. griseofulvum]|uniref:Uncharacterized protein n=1 Tax=Penicillium cf. griseofulvum TaxID=2972120 RepID=A0A9W9J5A3_9EURO|nr:hypothetical protein N7472_009038 [Penicillium cf. griseofulvum]KAJ5427493.1 hypothetical protein N7491_007935 [Penicillium cf. griseofulvum]KAJ5431694.1 hypothetical protein N7445_008192 [Penicillium cf. griseofulvum]